MRAAIGCLIAGVGLLNIADADSAHAVGVICLLAFAVLGCRAIIFDVVREQPAGPTVRAKHPTG